MRRYKKIYSNEKSNFFSIRLLLILFLSFCTISTWTQTKTVIIEDNKISIRQAFSKIEKQTGYLFVVNTLDLDLSRRVELPSAPTNLNQMLDKVLENTGCNYKFNGKNIIVVKSASDKTIEQSSSVAQISKPLITQTIKGVVIDDETGHPLIGAKVSVSGVLNSTVETDHAGTFTIQNVPEGVQHIRTYLEGYYLSERGVQVNANSEEIQIPLKTTSVSLGSIRSDADKGGIITAETSLDAANAISLIPRDTNHVEMSIVTMEQTKMLSPYTNGVEHRNMNWGIKTNLLYLATMSPNIGIEYRFAPKWTTEITVGFNMFEWGGNRSFNHWVVKPEVRYWTCRPFDGHFFGVHGIVGRFNVSELPIDFIKKFPENTNYVGWAYGGGVTYGYQWAIDRHLNLEAAIGVGYIQFQYDLYDILEDCKSCRYTKARNYFGPTKVGISLIYTF